MDKTAFSNKKIGLVLSGGGIRGMAHIGFIKAMQEHKMEAHVIAGTSVGAIVGALYANGNSAEEMLSFFKEAPLFQYNFFALGKPGLIDTAKYFSIFKEYFPTDNFSDLEKKLFIIATDLLNGEEVVFNKGELIYPLLASAALTPIFSPIEINNILYADGGIMNNFPKEYLDDDCDFVIGSNVSIAETLEKKHLKNVWQLAGRVTGLMIYASCKEKLDQCDLFIEPKELENIGMLDKKGINKAYQLGYERGNMVLEQYMASISCG